MRRRDLSGEERELWALATRDVTPAKKRKRKAPAVIAQAPRRAATNERPRPANKEIAVQASAPATRIAKDRTPAAKPPAAFGAGDPMVDRKVARGLMPIDARLDLHGMTQVAAHARVTRFILGARADGLRLVLIITGKGARSGGEGRGVIRAGFFDWVESAPLRSAIARVATAKPKDGGAGAFYVFLKRKTRG